MSNQSFASGSKTPEVSPAEVAASMFEQDAASQLLGMQLGAVDFGCANVTMEVGWHMVNGHGNCHGGLIFSLADTAFAMACNTYNEITVGSSCHIDYIRPVQAGDTLTADAKERALAGRSGLYDTTIYNQNDQIVAVFHGRAQRLHGAVIHSAETPDQKST